MKNPSPALQLTRAQKSAITNRNRKRNREHPNLRQLVGMMGGNGVLAPDFIKVKLKYMDELFPVPSSGAVFHYVFRGNSVFDPDYTGTGGQPMGFDQWTAFYKQFTVTGSRCTITGADTSGTSGASTYYAALVPSMSATDFVTEIPIDVGEFKYAKSKIFNNHQGNQAQNRLSSFIATKKVMGITLPTLHGMTTYAGTIASNPVHQFFWHINLQSVDVATTMADVQLYVEVEYEVIFWIRLAQTAS